MSRPSLVQRVREWLSPPTPAATRVVVRPSLPRRAYTAAQGGRLLADLAGTATSANKTTRYQAAILRHKARELRENSPLVQRYALLVRDNIVGPDGITLQAMVPSTRGTNTAASAVVESAWYQWAESCTPCGQTWDAVCRTLAESWKVEGEAWLELMPNPAAPMGLWVKPLDADLIDHTTNEEQTPTGGSVVQGVEYDAAGRVIGYVVWTRHPSEGHSRRTRRVPADRLLYLPNTHRPYQTRGVTALAPAMTLLHHLERTEEAIVILNRVTASKMGALIPGEDAAPIVGPNGESESETMPPEIEQAPAEWWTLPRGWDVKMLDPGQPTAEFAAFATHLERNIAASLGVAHSSLTGNLSEINYSSMRGGLLLERDMWMGAQQAFIAALVRPVFALFLRTASLAVALAFPVSVDLGAIARASTWHPRRWPWVDPVKDAQGIELLLSLGLTTKTREANKQGLAFTDLVDERAAEDAYVTASGVTLGTAAPVPAPADDEPAAPPTRTLRVAS
jgi:lambda family phage portal protein